MKIKRRVRPLWKWIGIIFVIGFVTFIVYDFAVNGPKAKLVQSQLENEFKSIAPLPYAKDFGYQATHKTSQALVTSNYKTNLSYIEIRAHYHAELAKHGWIFYEEEQMRDWGRAFGGKSARYCKGEYRADLQYAGKQANYGWDYALSISWGLGSIMDKHSEKFLKVGCQ
jgi:hypothetical protein